MLKTLDQTDHERKLVAELKFTVDAKLLRELGERLVGRPHMALAELIKNSYDADARNVVITFADATIRVVDDGHGMSEFDFIKRWMRIGTTVKSQQVKTPVLGRTLTGSKGVGRLAVQLLSRELRLTSVAIQRPQKADLANRDSLPVSRLTDQICAEIRWPAALLKNELTDVSVEFTTETPTATFAEGSRCGTEIILSDLVDTWTPAMFQRLAQEIWALQPPFAVPPDSEQAFNVILKSSEESITETFEMQMRAILDIASATVTGELLPARSAPPKGHRFVLPDAALGTSVEDDAAQDATESKSKTAMTRQLLIKVKLDGARLARYVVKIPDCQIAAFDYEIKVFDLSNRQPKGVKVGVARDYLSRFGGVQIYDNGFRLPYYGPDQDWLRIEIDHAHRLSRSALLPVDLQHTNALQDLPNNNRVYGYVNVSTSAEAAAVVKDNRRQADALAIQITRDRLTANQAYDQLRRAVRVGLDLYARERARTKSRDTLKRRGQRKDTNPVLNRASEVVETLKEDIPAPAYQTLRDSVDLVIEDARARHADQMAYAALLGALATAGINSLAYEHEISKQRANIQQSARDLRELAEEAGGELGTKLRNEADRLDGWAARAERIRALFRPLLDEETRVEQDRYSARKMAQDVTLQMSVLARGAKVDCIGVPSGLRLPMGGYAAWSAVLQNLLTNAFRATQKTKPRLIRIDGGVDNKTGWLRVQDNGEGVDLSQAERLFEPFERGAETDTHSEALGLGGSGLGLTIVRMALDEIGATAAFVEPEKGWSTAVRIEWKAHT